MLKNCRSTFSVAQLYEKVTPHLKPALASSESIERILKFSELLPSEIPPSKFGFECALSNKCQVDMAFYWDIPKIDLNLLSSSFHPTSLRPLLQRGKGWKELSLMIEKAINAQFFQKSGVPAFWLEFDVGSDSNWPPSPNVLFYHPEITEENTLACLDLVESRKSRPIIELVITQARVYDLHFVCVGFMMARSSDWSKLIIRPSSSATVLEPFLRDVGYRHSVAPLIELIKKISPELKSINFQIDISETLHPRICIECFLFNPTRKSPSFLQTLASENLISQEELEAIGSWPGGVRHLIDGEEFNFIRYINNFKISFEPGRNFRAKAYLGAFCSSN